MSRFPRREDTRSTRAQSGRNAWNWTVKVGSRTVDLKGPVIGLLVGASLLLSLRVGAARTESAVATSRGHASMLGSVTGIVLDRNGDPIPGAQIYLLGDAGETIATTTSSGAAEGPLALGEFKVDQLPRGKYSLRAQVSQSDATAVLASIPVWAFEDTRVRLKVDMGY